MSMFRGQMNVCLGFAATKNVVTVTEEIKLFLRLHTDWQIFQKVDKSISLCPQNVPNCLQIKLPVLFDLV